MSRSVHPEFIIITGSGKKVGKTHLAAALIRHFSPIVPVTGLKISPHHHDSLGRVELLTKEDPFRIFRELDVHGKNSGMYLRAGAAESYFMETEDAFLLPAFRFFLENCNLSGHPVICESGALGRHIQPGILIYIENTTHQTGPGKLVQRSSADLILPARTFETDQVTSRLQYVEGRWVFHQD